MKLHLIDTDVFIRANREHYGLDYCPAFWDWLVLHGQADSVGSVDAVLKEIRYPIELKQWARGPGRQLFRAVDTDVLAAAKDLSRWVHGAGYLPGAVTSFLSKADYWMVSHALAHGCVVVTHEVAAQTVKKVKIPSACRGLGVPCMDPWTMLRTIGARFILDRGGSIVRSPT